MGRNSFSITLLSCVLVTDAKGNYLLVQEAKDKPYSKCKDKWTIPHGSYDREGESILDLATRELLEETGGKAVFDERYICVEGFSIPLNKLYLICVIWYAKEWKRIQERISEEIKDIKFFSKNEISKFTESNQIRDNLPILEIIQKFETEQKGIIRWNLNIS